MALSSGEVQTLWNQRMPILTLRDAKWVLQSFWVPPLVMILPFLSSRFSADVLLGGAVAAAAFALYSMVTYGLWRSVPRVGSIPEARARMCILAIMGYDGLSLLYTSLCFLAAFLFGAGYLPFSSGWVVAASILLYAGIVIALTVRGDSIVRYLMQSHIRAKNRPLAPEARWALIISSELVGAGVALGAILRASSLGSLLAIGGAALVAFLLLPFAVVALSQVLMMVGRQSDLAAGRANEAA